MIGAERTLLSYLDAPVVIGDPDGQAVYVNPAFELRFERAIGRVPGVLLAELFEGGAREAVLRAVMRAVREGENVRFRLREGAQGFSAVASPIASDGESVGVVILLKEEVEGLERVLALHRSMEQPMDELGQVVQHLLELPVVAREARLCTLLGDAQQALGRLRKGADEVHAVLTGTRDPAANSLAGAGAIPRRFDPGGLLHRVAARAERSGGAEGCRIEVVVAPALPMLPGDSHRIEALLLRLLELRLAPTASAGRLVLAARHVVSASGAALLVSICELGRGGARGADPPQLAEEAAALDAELRSVVHPSLGRATVLRLRAPS